MARPSENNPPTIDPVAAHRWAEFPQTVSPWLHEEVAQRMAQRLQAIRLPVARWADWSPVRGGLAGHDRVAAHYPDAERFRVISGANNENAAPESGAKSLWQRLRRQRPQATDVRELPRGAVQLVWANMLAHGSAGPAALLQDWHRALAVGGYVMFSCLGPDTVREIHRLYADMGWPVPGHAMTDMHDWGDQLVAAGFAEPVMDMERITLTFATPERLLQELRELGRNLHPARFGGLRGRAWHGQLLNALREGLAMPGGHGELALTFEIIYGHALKAAPRHAVQTETTIGLDDLRDSLRRRNTNLPPA